MLEILIRALPVIFLLSSCLDDEADSRRFYERLPEERYEAFSHLSLDQQYSYYVYGMRNVYPRPTYLMPQIAKRREAATPFLIDKLHTADTDEAFMIAEIFSTMRVVFGYDPCEDHHVPLSRELEESLESRGASLCSGVH